MIKLIAASFLVMIIIATGMVLDKKDGEAEVNNTRIKFKDGLINEYQVNIDNLNYQLIQCKQLLRKQ